MLPLFEEMDQSWFCRALECARGREGFVLLESSMLLEGAGRHSFFSFDPFLVVEFSGGRVNVSAPGGPARDRGGNPFAALRQLLQDFAAPRVEGLPPFQCGAAGWFSYDLGRALERLPSTAADDAGYPEMRVCFYDAVASLDRVAGRAWVVSSGLPEKDGAALRRAERRIAEFRDLDGAPSRSGFAIDGALESNFSRDGYMSAVERCRRYIVDGDIFQVNLSQRFESGFSGDPFALYLRLREASPAPFSAFVSAPGACVVSSSPERFLLLRSGAAQTRPIKGTRRRGADKAEDSMLAEELLGSEKDRAENTMIVDLMRNDFGRVCRPGSVRVTGLCELERFPNVFHLTSTVVGSLSLGNGAADLLEACFPGGSITGAPKVRAMEIIEELEPSRRGVYTGAIGYLGFDGSMDLNIAIRTAVVSGGKLRFQAGGGIVYDSDPADEYDETLHKARGLMDALRVAPTQRDEP